MEPKCYTVSPLYGFAAFSFGIRHQMFMVWSMMSSYFSVCILKIETTSVALNFLIQIKQGAMAGVLNKLTGMGRRRNDGPNAMHLCLSSCI